MGWRRGAAAAFDRSGAARITARWFGRDRLTVLAYHRVIDLRDPEFIGFAGNVSASPEAFSEQMALVSRRFNPVAIDDVVAALGGAPLPDRAALVTFDDGYRDNLDAALPILEEHGIPATVFLATDHVGSSEPFWWDLAAWMISIASRRPASIPLLDAVDWGDPHRVAVRWIAAAKGLEDGAKSRALAGLADAVGSTGHDGRFAGTHLDWDAVRDMQTRGVSFGAHTCSHPILTRVEPAESVRQVGRSVEVVHAETGRRPLAFAYPNGLESDFDEVAIDAVIGAGVPTAFTLLPGPARWREVIADPHRIRRIYVHHHDDRVRFVAKLAGVPRLLG